jgi:hypothetical protein
MSYGFNGRMVSGKRHRRNVIAEAIREVYWWKPPSTVCPLNAMPIDLRQHSRPQIALQLEEAVDNLQAGCPEDSAIRMS